MNRQVSPVPHVAIAEWQTVEAFHRALTTPMTTVLAPSRREADIVSVLAEADVLISASFTLAMAAAAPRLRLIQTPGAGLEQIDVSAIPPGVSLCNVYGHEQGIAEYVVMTMTALNRDLMGMNRRLREGDWRDYQEVPQPELRGRTLAVIGLGRIGRAVARAGAFFGMRVLAVTRNPDAVTPEDAPGVVVSGLETLHSVLAEADFVVLSLPLNDATRGLIGPAEFAAMKPGAYLINVARGGVVDEAALYDALSSGTIAGAAIDVWYQYPASNEICMPSRYPFHELDNILMTPHISGATDGTFTYRWQFINDNIRRLAAGEPLQNVVTVGKAPA